MRPKGWSAVTLRPHLDLLSGCAFRSEYFTEDPAGPPLVRIRDLKPGSSETYYSGEYEERFIISPGSILVGMDGDFSAVRWEQTGCLLNQRVLRVASASPTVLDEAFLFYRLNKELPELQRIIGGTTVKHLSQKHLKNLRVSLPPVPEQRKIAAILSGVDDAIAATRKVIEQTKRVKQGLLQTLMTRGIGHTRFKRTEIGEIPETWKLVHLGDLMEDGLRNGYSPNSPKDPTGRWVLSLGALNSEGLQVSQVKPAPVEDSRLSKFLLKPGDFLISRSNTRARVGWSSVFRGEVEACSFPDLMMQFRVREEVVVPEFVEAYLFSPAALSYFQGQAAGTSGSMVKLNQSMVRRLPAVVPPRDEQKEIARIFAAIREQLQSTSQAEHSFSMIQRGLMQDLLSGRVRVLLD